MPDRRVGAVEAMSSRREPPDVCPECGAVDAYEVRYTTGGGWRVDHYRCGSCGRRVDPRGVGDQLE